MPEPCRKRPGGATRTQLGKHRRTAFDQARWQPQDRTRLPSSGANCPADLLSTRTGGGLCDPTCYRPGRVQGGEADGPVKDDRPAARERERPKLYRERQRQGGRMERRVRPPMKVRTSRDLHREPSSTPEKLKHRTRTQWYSAPGGVWRDTATGAMPTETETPSPRLRETATRGEPRGHYRVPSPRGAQGATQGG